MLVLSRKKNESIVIADGEIEVSIVEIRGDKVKLGISAPESITVDRLEVWLAKQRVGLERGSDQDSQRPPALAAGEGCQGNEDHAGGSEELLCDQVKSGPERKQSRRA